MNIRKYILLLAVVLLAAGRPAAVTAAEAAGSTDDGLFSVTIPGLDHGSAVYNALFSESSTYAETGIPAVALTFDDGPGEKSTDRILDTLEKYQVPATFFLIGNKAGNRPEVLKRMISDGCELGSHTYSHKKMTGLSREQWESEYQRSIDAIEAASGGKVTLFRPPYGSLSQEQRQEIELPVILWSLDTLDWKTRDPKATLSNVQNQLRKAGGDIILLHDIHDESADAVEKLVPWLIEHGYRIMTVSRLYEYYGEELSPHIGHAYAGTPEKNEETFSPEETSSPNTEKGIESGETADIKDVVEPGGTEDTEEAIESDETEDTEN